MGFIPVKQSLDLCVHSGVEVDRFGNERPSDGRWVSVGVASWWIDRSEEKAGDSVLRTVDMLHAHLPADTPVTAASKLRLPDGSEWSVEGNPEDYNHGWHGWEPGLLVVHAKKVEG